MQFISDNKIIGEPLYYFYKEENFELPKRLQKRNYAIPFKVLINFNLIKTFAINRYKLTSDYIHLLKQGQSVEN